MEFSAELRKALLRNIARNGLTWSGTVEAPTFYGQFFDLANLPSTDPRYSDAAGDMWQHTVNNSDWSDDDIINDPRFSPLQLSNDDFAKFVNAALDRETRPREELEKLAEAIRPVVAHAGAHVVRREEFGIFEGYIVSDQPEDESHGATASPPPANWLNAQRFRLFISHIAIHKDKAIRLKSCLARYGIDGFVAHEDIEPTLEWQSEIEKALRTMDAFVAIHTVGFAKSIWTQQEVGYAVGRGVKIISLQMGEDPTGFISKHQALRRGHRKAEEVAAEIDGILAKDPRTRDKLRAAKDALR
jgi:AbiJ N-terminal domain 3/TIR domain